MFSTIAYNVLGIYLVTTLASTSLAKLKSRRTTVVGVLAERVIPPPLVPFTIAAVASAELCLAVAITIGHDVLVTGLATASALVVFGIYRLAVAAKNRKAMCTCAGYLHVQTVSPLSVTVIAMGSALQAGIAVVWGYLGTGQPWGSWMFVASGWAPPLLALARGRLRARPSQARGPSVE